MAKEIWIDVCVANPRHTARMAAVRALVDNGSTDSALPATLLGKLGIRPMGVQSYAVWGNRTLRRKWGEAFFEIQGEKGTCRVTFEPATEIPTIGAVALETLGFDIDMMNGKLRKGIRHAPPFRIRLTKKLRREQL